MVYAMHNKVHHFDIFNRHESISREYFTWKNEAVFMLIETSKQQGEKAMVHSLRNSSFWLWSLVVFWECQNMHDQLTCLDDFACSEQFGAQSSDDLAFLRQLDAQSSDDLAFLRQLWAQSSDDLACLRQLCASKFG